MKLEVNGHLLHFSTQLKEHFKSRFAIAELLQKKWSQNLINDQDRFKQEVLEFHAIYPDFQAISWVNMDRVITWVNPEAPNVKAKGLDLGKLDIPNATIDNSIKHNSLQTTPPLTLAQGGKGFVGYLPLYFEGELQGYLNLVFRAKPAIDAAVHEKFHDRFILNVYDQEISLIPVVEYPDNQNFLNRRQVQIGSRQWTVEISPTEKELKNSTNYLGELVLFFGIALTIMLSLVVRALLIQQLHLKDNEKRFKDLATVSSDWFWELDENLDFSYISPRYEEVSGDLIKDRLGKKRWDSSSINKNEPHWQKHIKDLEARKPFKNFEYSIEIDKGKKHYFRLSGIPNYNSNGKFIGYRGGATDITNEREATESLQLALQEAEYANRAKSEFLATMSHEFRTPLNAILGFSDMLRSQYFGPLGAKNYEGYADDIFSSGHLLLALINDLLDISAIEAGKRELHLEEIDVKELAEKCIRNIEPLAKQKYVTLSTSYDEDLPKLTADTRSLVQILINVLANAIKFNKDNGFVKLSASCNKNTKNITITIEDNGVGIPKKNLKNITDPFSRSHSNPLVAQEGSGLGLSIVKSLVEMHCGKLDIESEVDKGTIVTITLPIRPDL